MDQTLNQLGRGWWLLSGFPGLSAFVSDWSGGEVVGCGGGSSHPFRDRSRVPELQPRAPQAVLSPESVSACAHQVFAVEHG